MKKRVLCFGDSNTWGYIPGGAGRYDEETRWPMRLAKLLGEDYAVIEEGLNGRTCVFDDPTEGGYKSGAAHLPVSLMSHAPLDVVIIMLGTNDTKQRFCMGPRTVSGGLNQLARLARQYAFDAAGAPSRLLLIAPAPITEGLMQASFAESFGMQAIGISRGLAREYARVAAENGCDFLDAAGIAEVSGADGVHLSPEGHAALAAAVADKIRSMIA